MLSIVDKVHLIFARRNFTPLSLDLERHLFKAVYLGLENPSYGHHDAIVQRDSVLIRNREFPDMPLTPWTYGARLLKGSFERGTFRGSEVALPTLLRTSWFSRAGGIAGDLYRRRYLRSASFRRSYDACADRRRLDAWIVVVRPFRAIRRAASSGQLCPACRSGASSSLVSPSSASNVWGFSGL